MSSELSYLTAEQRAGLSDLPFSVLLPSALPEGWSLEAIDLLEEDEGASFSLSISSGGKRCAFLTSNEGIGDPPPGIRQSTHQHPQIGELIVEHEEDGALLSDWVEVDNGWSAVGGNDLDDADLDLIIPQLVVV